jgi:ketosteroid isomerase-like protein
MRRILALSLFALFTFVALTPNVWAQAPTSKPAQGDPAEEVMQMQKRFADAIQRGDTAALAKIWADDYTFTNGSGQLVTRAQRLANLRSGATNVQSADETDVKVRVYGRDAAVLTSRVVLKAQYSGKQGSGEYRNTAFWVKTTAGWQMAANQITLIAK